MTFVHLFPTRAGALDIVRHGGGKAMYGPKWKHSDAKTIALLESLSDSEYATRSGCNHHDEQGNCLGHDDDEKGGA